MAVASVTHAAPIHSLARELPCATDAAIKKKKKGVLCHSDKVCNRLSSEFSFKLITYIRCISKVWGILL